MTRLFFAKQYHYYNTALKSEKSLGKYHRLPQKAKKQNKYNIIRTFFKWISPTSEDPKCTLYM